MKSIRVTLVVVSVMLSSCKSSDEEMRAATEALPSQAWITEAMKAGTAEFETKLATGLQPTPTSQPIRTLTQSDNFSSTAVAIETEMPIPAPASTDTPAVTEGPTLITHEQQRTDLVLLCFALYSHYYLRNEYFEAEGAWKPKLYDSDTAPEVRDAMNFSRGALGLRDSVHALPVPAGSAKNFIQVLERAYEQLGRSYYYLALYYKEGSRSERTEGQSSWENAWQLYEQASDEWTIIADEYEFDPLYCNHTAGEPTLGIAQDPTEDLSPEDMMAKIESQVSALRGWQLEEEPERRLMSREELREYNEEHFLEDHTQEEMDDDARTLVALDLIEPGFDLYQMYFDYRTEGILGFYDDEEDVMVDISDVYHLDEVARGTHAHEYQHALQFHNNDMEAIGYSEEGWEEDSERGGAIQAVIEGEASLVERLWKNAHFTIQEQKRAIELSEAMEPPPQVPRWYEDDSYFPYREGYNFVANVYSVGGWSAVNKLYKIPPMSTEVILHPEKYWQGDKPIKVDPVGLADVLGVQWREFDSNVMGEWWTYLILREHILDYHARFAAAGWGGDSYAVAHNESTDQTTLVIKWVWDTTIDAEEFSAAFLRYNQARFGTEDRGFSSGTQNCWTGDRVSCMVTNDEGTLWVLGPSISIVSKVIQILSD